MAELSATMEDYLEAMYRLELDDRPVRVKEIADLLEVTMPSVSSALQTLEERKLIDHQKYRAIEFTAAGRKLAQEIYRRHQGLRQFFVEILQLDVETAEEQACKMEHALNAETLKRLLALIEFIKHCPRGGDDWLAHLKGRWEGGPCADNCDECIAAIEVPATSPFAAATEAMEAKAPPDTDTEDKRAVDLDADLITLDQLKPGQRGVIVRLNSAGPVRRRIMDMGFSAGSELDVERLAPLGDPIEFKIRGYHISMRHQEAANIYVRPT